MNSEDRVKPGSKADIRKTIKAVRNAMDRVTVHGDLNLYADVCLSFLNTRMLSIYVHIFPKGMKWIQSL